VSVRKLGTARVLINTERVQLGTRDSSRKLHGAPVAYVDLVADECFSMSNAQDRHRVKVLAEKMLEQLKLNRWRAP
jgi:hypothetical protein